MKRLFYLVPFIFISKSALPQKFAVGNDEENIFYLGVPNPLSVTVEKYPCTSVLVKTDNGTLTGYACRYDYVPSHIGHTKIFIFRKANNKIIKVGEADFRVKKIPDPIIEVGPCNSGNVDKRVLGNQQFLRAELENFDIDARFSIESYKVLVFKGDSLIFNKTSNSGKLPQELREAILSLEKDDIVLFENVQAMGPDGKILNLQPIVFTIMY